MNPAKKRSSHGDDYSNNGRDDDFLKLHQRRFYHIKKETIQHRSGAASTVVAFARLSVNEIQVAAVANVSVNVIQVAAVADVSVNVIQVAAVADVSVNVIQVAAMADVSVNVKQVVAVADV